MIRPNSGVAHYVPQYLNTASSEMALLSIKLEAWISKTREHFIQAPQVLRETRGKYNNVIEVT